MFNDKGKQMKTVKFETHTTFERLFNEYEGLKVSDFLTSGVYRIHCGSRGLTEEVIKVSDTNEFELREMKDIMKDYTDDEGFDEEDLEFIEEFVETGKTSWKDDIEEYFESFSEEDCFYFYYVKV